MTSHSVNLKGQEHLPPIMLEWLAPDYQYSTHRHSIVTTELGLEHHYTVISFNQRLSEQKIAELIDKIEKPEPPKALDKRSRSPDRHPANRSGHMVSQISSTTTSEKRMCPMTAAMDLSVGKTPATTSSSSYASSTSLSNTSNGTSRETGPISPISSPTASEREQRSSAPQKPMFTTASMASKSHLPEYTYLSPGLTKSRSSKCVMMVQVKFLFLHRDIFNRRVQTMYRDEFPSDCPLEDVVFNFHQLCARNFRLRGREFSPRLAFCIGELEQNKSRPVTKQDIRKSLAQLAKTHSIGKFVLIADNINEQ